ncbi:MAG: hypothetical protein IK122_00910 [Alphaproteobacteria bacterium]|jgi:hypothetical protein|nr:hypothetical protein [Alphaproteobacteria bacterium]MBR5354672.1 hypothetical protein [Alphaproteobacteria bacterium]MBR6502534.1 hypothetical protein [Clostridia bacterium]
MAHVEINTYGANDEIVKTFTTNHIKWGLICRAVEIEEKMNDEELKGTAAVKVVNDFILSVFPDMTQSDIEAADIGDIFNVFKMISHMGGNINTSKNG